MSGRGKGKTAGKKQTSRSSKAGLQVHIPWLAIFSYASCMLFLLPLISRAPPNLCKISTNQQINFTCHSDTEFPKTLPLAPIVLALTSKILLKIFEQSFHLIHHNTCSFTADYTAINLLATEVFITCYEGAASAVKGLSSLACALCSLTKPHVSPHAPKWAAPAMILN